MKTQNYSIARLCLLLMPVFLLACSFLVDIDTGKKTATPTATEVSRLPDPVFPVDLTPTLPCPSLPTPEPARSCPQAGEPQPISPVFGTNVALDKPVIQRAGGIDYADWANASDAADYNRTTLAENGRWGNNTNGGAGSYETVDLGRVYRLTGVGYTLDWDGAFGNPLAFQVLISTDLETWTLVANNIHRYVPKSGSNRVELDQAIAPISARYVKYIEPPDGEWNGWGDFFQLRAYAEE